MTIRQPLLSSAPVQRYIIVGMLRIEYALPYYYNSSPYSFFSKNSSVRTPFSYSWRSLIDSRANLSEVLCYLVT